MIAKEPRASRALQRAVAWQDGRRPPARVAELERILRDCHRARSGAVLCRRLRAAERHLGDGQGQGEGESEGLGCCADVFGLQSGTAPAPRRS